MKNTNFLLPLAAPVCREDLEAQTSVTASLDECFVQLRGFFSFHFLSGFVDVYSEGNRKKVNEKPLYHFLSWNKLL